MIRGKTCIIEINVGFDISPRINMEICKCKANLSRKSSRFFILQLLATFALFIVNKVNKLIHNKVSETKL